MRWIEATVKTSTEEIDALCALLGDLGVGGMVIEDEADFRNFLENNQKYWDYVDEELEQKFSGVSQVKFYLADDADGAATMARVRAAVSAPITQAFIEDSDWENNWREFYKPIPVGDRLLVVPEWETPEADGRIMLRLDPGLIFGTGSHATTRMCLCALETLAKPGTRALDLGCGSGILGIGALLLGCDSVVGCDIDPKAPDVAAANAALNGIGPDRFQVYAGDVLSDKGMCRRLGSGYGIVLANIVSDVIIPLSGIVSQFLAPDGVFVCSGIIEGRQAEVQAAVEAAGFSILDHRCEEEWHCFTAVRK
jgi:ribosomal protein L11 methyltransferase